MRIAETMNVQELTNYIDKLEVSSIYFKDLSGSDKKDDTSNEADAPADEPTSESGDDEP